MSLMNVFNTGESALAANRMWLEVIAGNLANAQTTRTEEGGPYRRKVPLFSEVLDAEIQGVRVSAIEQDQSPLQRVYKPGHPDADKDGFVSMPNVNVVTEMVDMIGVQRSYDANVTVMQAIKSMANKSMDIGR
ncbi:MAG: flagellar basal body rod protein FlgC [Candidatus Sericytochromatia bacterium]|nr:flagellar basal body rod protein FlgC [Candidatus Tanganyikabacteria bacterium]MEB3204503.1 flagellar basal body rod protein FlgC [Candidatus Sericytochromatia bacterium]